MKTNELSVNLELSSESPITPISINLSVNLFGEKIDLPVHDDFIEMLKIKSYNDLREHLLIAFKDLFKNEEMSKENIQKVICTKSLVKTIKKNNPEIFI